MGGYMSVGRDGFKCGWLGLNQRAMVMRAVAALARANPKATIQALVSQDLLRPLIQEALKSDSSKALSEMLIEKELHHRKVIESIMGGSASSAADKQPPTKDTGINPAFTFRKIQAIAMANRSAEEKAEEGEVATLAFESKATLEESP